MKMVKGTAGADHRAAAPTTKEAARLTFDVEEITPERASRLLESAVNPAEDKKAISTYAQAMTNGACERKKPRSAGFDHWGYAAVAYTLGPF